jgi:hypothetical protein
MALPSSYRSSGTAGPNYWLADASDNRAGYERKTTDQIPLSRFYAAQGGPIRETQQTRNVWRYSLATSDAPEENSALSFG